MVQPHKETVQQFLKRLKILAMTQQATPWHKYKKIKAYVQTKNVHKPTWKNWKTAQISIN